jgi:hypothetical protein
MNVSLNIGDLEDIDRELGQMEAEQQVRDFGTHCLVVKLFN